MWSIGSLALLFSAWEQNVDEAAGVNILSIAEPSVSIGLPLTFEIGTNNLSFR